MYKKVFSYWKEENRKKELMRLPSDFYEKVLVYIEENKNKILEEGKENILARIILKENEIIYSLLNDLFKIRFKKIILIQKNGESVPIENLANLELKFFTNNIQKFGLFINNLELLQKEEHLEKGVIEQEERKRVTKLKEKKEFVANKGDEKKESTSYTLIKINKELPEITGADLKIYGPFKKGDIVYLPEINAKILLEKNVANKINIK